jgi:hypothetical protein
LWTQLREAAGGRFERGAVQENRASSIRANLSVTALFVLKPGECKRRDRSTWGTKTGRPLDEETRYGMLRLFGSSGDEARQS